MVEEHFKQTDLRRDRFGQALIRFLADRSLPLGNPLMQSLSWPVRKAARDPAKDSNRETEDPVIAAEMPIAEGFSEGDRASDPTVQSPLNAPPPEGKPSSKAHSRAWRWSLVWLAMLGILGGMGTSALLWLVTLPPPPDCSNPAKLTLDGERLFCAREAARSGDLRKLIAGLDLVKQWDADHPLQAEANKLRDEWSKRLLVIAREKVNQSDMKGALAVISHIPKTASIYTEVQETVARWKKQWAAGESIAAKAQAAMKQQKWDEAYTQISLLNDSTYDYWRLKRSAELAQQLGAEKQAWQVLAQAKKLATEGLPQLSQAIVLAQQVPAKTYAEAESQQLIKQWGQTLLNTGIEKWKQGETSTAINLLRLPAKATLTSEMSDIVKFGNAYRLVGNIHSRWVPSINQIWDLREAIGAIQQVKPNSPFYAQAQTHRKNWETQLQDMIQLQYATAAAYLGQRDTLQLAIAQAKQVEIDRPRRRQAQTLISHWLSEVERLEDQPYLARAQAIAQSGKIPDLKAAIAQASQVAPDRSLRRQAQDLIASWQDQIETQEDQPILDQAITLANQGDLAEAIERAGKIQAGRALYAQAQARIDDWQVQQIVNAQIAADQPILDRAMAQAKNGDLASAIGTAAQIAPGRALYSQAQAEIAQWRSERDRVWEPQPRANEAWGYSDDSSSTDPAFDPDIPMPEPADQSAPAEPEPLPSIELVPPPAQDSANPIDQSPEPPIIVQPESIPAENAESDQNSSNSGSSYEGYYDERYYETPQ